MATNKSSGAEQVASFLHQLEHPLKDEIEEVRRIVLNAVPDLTEHIKWNAPSFCHEARDRITFQLQGKGFFRLIFHTGAKPKERAEKGRVMEDSSGLLEWAADDRAIVKFFDIGDVNAKKDDLSATVMKWIDATN